MPSTTKLQSCLPLLCPKSPPKPYSPACTTVASSCKACKSALHHSGFDCHPFFGTENSSAAAPHTVIISRGKVVSKRLEAVRDSSTFALAGDYTKPSNQEFSILPFAVSRSRKLRRRCTCFFIAGCCQDVRWISDVSRGPNNRP